MQKTLEKRTVERKKEIGRASWRDRVLVVV